MPHNAHGIASPSFYQSSSLKSYNTPATHHITQHTWLHHQQDRRLVAQVSRCLANVRPLRCRQSPGNRPWHRRQAQHIHFDRHPSRRPISKRSTANERISPLLSSRQVLKTHSTTLAIAKSRARSVDLLETMASPENVSALERKDHAGDRPRMSPSALVARAW